ncbi:MAG: PP2C family protein-serine/threonine phosphatase [Gimesia chilikensis]|uniref:PP2C family protein-serine/threonine phosphatase n=1 Tax=Gimesia chilikensis TaxID=2605989 RepID=UPI0037A0F767
MSVLFARIARFKNQPRTIRFQLLLSVNLTLSIALAGLLILQYHREIEHATAQMRTGLNDEAIAIQSAVSHLIQDHTDHQNRDVQSYINKVCSEMRKSASPGHRIIVSLNGKYIQTGGTTPDSKAILSEFDFTNPESFNLADFQQHQLVIGYKPGKEASVFVIETLKNVRRAIRTKVLVQLAVLGALGLIAAGIVNLVLLKFVGRPLNQLLKTVEDIRSGNLDTIAPGFTSSEMNLLSSSINSMSAALKENDRDRRTQMEKARKIQQYLLPHGVQISQLDTAHIFEPADSVAGDYYDFLPLSDGSWLICIADVSGHGVPAAMGAAMLKSLLLAASETPPFDPVTIMTEVNRQFTASILPGNFASMFLARWEPESQTLTWVSAGHLPGLLQKKSGALEALKSTGLLIGIDLNAEWEQKTTRLSPEDRILLFSDGVTESTNAEGTLFGVDRLTDLFSHRSDSSLLTEIMRINETIAKWRSNASPNDDLTLVALECQTVKELNQSKDRSSRENEELNVCTR